MILEKIVVGPFQSNCWILGCGQTREGVIIDPGDEAEHILQVVESHQLTLRALIHTHGHLDHANATRTIKERLDVPILIHEADAELLQSLPLQASLFGLTAEACLPPDQFISEGETIAFGKYKLRAIETPGHTPGGICLQLEDSHPVLLFTGDTLFQGSIGRTDLWGGSYALLIRSIREKLWGFEDDTILHPGHGPSTTLGHEKRHNPFLASFRD